MSDERVETKEVAGMILEVAEMSKKEFEGLRNVLTESNRSKMYDLLVRVRTDKRD